MLSLSLGIRGNVRSPRQKMSSLRQRVRGLFHEVARRCHRVSGYMATSAHLVAERAHSVSTPADFLVNPGTSWRSLGTQPQRQLISSAGLRTFSASPGTLRQRQGTRSRCLGICRDVSSHRDRVRGSAAEVSGFHREIASSWAASGRLGHAASSEPRDGSSPAGPARFPGPNWAP